MVEPFRGMLVAPNALLNPGGDTTVTLALAVLPGPPSVEVTAVVTLFLTPAVVPVTFTTIVQEPLVARVPADKLTLLEPAVAVGVPPQPVLTRPLGVATVSPPGRLSVNAIPVSATLLFGLVMVNVSVVLPFNGIVAAPKALLIDGGEATVTVAVLLATPVPPSVELGAPVVLFFAPEVVPVTFTMIVQLALAASEPPVRLTLPDPATAVMVPVQVPPRPFGVATTRPAGRVSVTAMAFCVTVVLGLVSVSVRLVDPFSAMFAAPNALVIVTGATTVTVAVLLTTPVPPSFELGVPVVLFLTPAVVPVTFNVIVQVPLVPSEPPVRLTLLDPATSVIVPVQVPP